MWCGPSSESKVSVQLWERTGQEWISIKPSDKDNQKAVLGQEEVRKLPWNQWRWGGPDKPKRRAEPWSLFSCFLPCCVQAGRGCSCVRQAQEESLQVNKACFWLVEADILFVQFSFIVIIKLASVPSTWKLQSFGRKLNVQTGDSEVDIWNIFSKMRGFHNIGMAKQILFPGLYAGLILLSAWLWFYIVTTARSPF